MATYYQLLDLDAGTLMGAYPDEAMALDVVRRGVAEDGAALWQNVALFRSEGGDSPIIPIAQGGELLTRAQTVVPTPVEAITSR